MLWKLAEHPLVGELLAIGATAAVAAIADENFSKGQEACFVQGCEGRGQSGCRGDRSAADFRILRGQEGVEKGLSLTV